MEFKPGDPTIVYASTVGYSYSYVFRSTNTGDSWTQTAQITNGRRGELAIAPSDPTIVYLAAANSGGGVLGIYKSTNSGASFSVSNSGSPAGMLGYYSDGSGAATGQNSYDFCITVSPTNANEVYLGGVTLWKSTDGGTTFAVNSMWTSSTSYNFNGSPVVHADHHCLSFQTNTTLFDGNDGGIYKTTNGGTNWTDLSNGLIISQVYKIGVSKTDQNKMLVGMQDNGTKKYTGAQNTYVDVHGGDGFECIIDFNNATSYMYVAYTNGQIYRNSNGYSTFAETKISSNIWNPAPTGAWVTPYIMNPLNAATLYAGYDAVYKTINRGTTWTVNSQSLSTSNKVRSLAMAPSDTNRLYAAALTTMFKTTDGGATNWSSITLPTTAVNVTFIAVKKNDPNTVWITYGGFSDGIKVYKSTDAGTSWTNISTGLPNLPIMSIVQQTDITNREVLYVGTDLGVYVKDGANAWAAFSDGLPNVVISELEIYYGETSDILRAGTYGRGLWETDLSSVPLPVELTSFTAKLVGRSISLQWSTATEVQNYGFQVQRAELTSSGASIDWKAISFINGNGNSNHPQSYSYLDNAIRPYCKYIYRLKQIDVDGSFHFSPSTESVMYEVRDFELSQNYPNPFNPSTTITFEIPYPEVVSIVVYDAFGRQVQTLVNELKAKGRHTVELAAANLSSGVYFYTMRSGNYISTRKLILLK